MTEELHLVRDLAIILVSAGVFTIISKALKQPLILGYIIAGFLIGPHITFFPGITSEETVHQWSEIGIIFLMFGLGLEFSFKKLLKVGSSALLAAGTKFLGVFVLGYLTGQAMSWSAMESIFLGGLLSMSSTMVVLKSYDDMGMKKKPYAGMVFGTLVVEDLIAILLMVLLSTMAVSNQFAGKEMLFNLAKLAFFLILWFLVGIYVIPTLLKKARRYLNDEILLIVSIGLCFGMVALAEAVGFSAALGAFVMGSILSETVESEHIDRLVGPIRDLFGAIFFVSVGMMVAPSVIAENWLVILIITLIVMISHILFAGAGILMAGKGLENAVHTGFSLAQLGEFGFIIAGVGVSLGVMRGFIYPVIIAVSVITTFTTPYMIKLAGPAYRGLVRILPAGAVARLQPQSRSAVSAAEESEWKKLLKAYALRILLYGVILVAIMVGSQLYLSTLVQRIVPGWGPFWKNFIEVIITLAAMSPFIFGLAVSSGSIKTSAAKLLKTKGSNAWPIAGLLIIRSFIAISFVIGVIASHFQLAGWTLVLIAIGGFVLIISARRTVHRNSALEERFLSNLNEKEERERQRTPVTSSVRQKMAKYDVHIESMELSPDSEFVGQMLKEVPIRAASGANIIKVQRGSHSVTIPTGSFRLFPHDRLLAVGTTRQLEQLRKLLAESNVQPIPEPKHNFDVVPVTLTAAHWLTGRKLDETNLRERRCMIISVLHEGEFITNPAPGYRFCEGDVVWIAGEEQSCRTLEKPESIFHNA